MQQERKNKAEYKDRPLIFAFAFFAATVTVPTLGALYNYITGQIPHSGKAAALLFWGFWEIGLAITFPFAFFLGLPAFILLRRSGYTRWGSSLLAGLAIGFIAYLISDMAIHTRFVRIESDAFLWSIWGMFGAFSAWCILRFMPLLSKVQLHIYGALLSGIFIVGMSMFVKGVYSLDTAPDPLAKEPSFTEPYFITMLKVKAENGDVKAQARLGMIYESGLNEEGVEDDSLLDYAEALKWLDMAASRGDLGSQRGLAWMYMHGKGVRQNNAKAMNLYLGAANKGDPESQEILGHLYESGRVVSQNWAQAYFWYSLAELGVLNAPKNSMFHTQPINAKRHLTPEQIKDLEVRIKKWLLLHKERSLSMP